MAATKASAAASQVQSAVSSAATFLEEIEEHVPCNCSLGTRQFRVGYQRDVQCSHLPFNLSSLLPNMILDLPGPAENTIRERVDTLAPLAERLTQFPILYALNTLIAGLVLIATITAFSIWLVFDRWSRIVTTLQEQNTGIRVLAHLGSGLGMLHSVSLACLHNAYTRRKGQRVAVLDRSRERRSRRARLRRSWLCPILDGASCCGTTSH
jgi:hypothetical protein